MQRVYTFPVCFLLCDTVATLLEVDYTDNIFMHKYLYVSQVTVSVTWNRETGTERAPPAKNKTKKKAFNMP